MKSIVLSKEAALIITGPRRCGKSILAYMLKSKNFAYVHFDDERLNMAGEELNNILEAIYSLKGDPDLIIFDEIQNISGWEKFVSRLIGTRKLIITGSNAKLMSSELASHLTGRHLDIVLLPFSFREMLHFKNFSYDINNTQNIAQIQNYLNEYMERGGFPLAYELGPNFLAETYKDVLEKDIIHRYKIKYPEVLKELTKYFLSNVATEISFTKLKNIFEIKSQHTIKTYASYLSSTYLVFFLERFSYKLKEQTIAPKKVYSMDTGLASVIGFKMREEMGRTMENLVAIELFRKTKNDSGMELYYWKNHQQREVDFVIKRQKTVTQLIQVTRASSKIEIPERELNSLIRGSEELKCNNLVVITTNYEAVENFSDKIINFVPLWKWLLQHHPSLNNETNNNRKW